MRFVKANLDILLIEEAIPYIVCTRNGFDVELFIFLVSNRRKIVDGVAGIWTSDQPYSLFVRNACIGGEGLIRRTTASYGNGECQMVGFLTDSLSCI